MTSSNQASDSTKQLKEQQYTEEHYRAIQKHTPRLRNNTPPVCTNRRSYELIIRRQASDTGKNVFRMRNLRESNYGLFQSKQTLQTTYGRKTIQMQRVRKNLFG